MGSTQSRDVALAAELASVRAELAAFRLGSDASTPAQRPVAELLSTAVAHSPIVLWCADRDGRCTLSEGRGLEPLGFHPGQVVGLSVWDLYADNAEATDLMRRAYNGEENFALVHVGDLVYESWAAPLRDETGEITGIIGVGTDVTARMKAEVAEHQFRRRFQRIFESSPVGIMLTRFATGQLIEVNPALCRMLQREGHELVGKTTIEVGFWADEFERHRILERARKTNFSEMNRHRIRTVHGELRIVECRGDLMEIDGTPCLLTVVHDVTAEYRAAKLLRRSRRRFKMLTRFAPVGIFRCSFAGKVLDTNRQLLRLWHVTRETLTAGEWWRVIHPADQAAVAEQWRRAQEQGTPFAAEFRLPGNEARWCFAQAETQQACRGLVVTATDITAQKRSEHALQVLNEQLETRVAERTAVLVDMNTALEEQIRERRQAVEALEVSHEKWRSLVQNAPDLIILVDRDSQITFINHTSVRPELGVSDIVGNSVYDFIFPEFYEKVRADLIRVFDHGESASHEVAGPNESGERLWFQSHLAPVWHNGVVVAATIVCRDVTKLRRAEDELKQKQDQLIHVGRVSVVGEMTAAIAHEMFQPLQAIIGYVTGCTRRLQEGQPVTADVMATLQDAVAEAHRASEIVKRMKSFLQRNELQCEPVAVQDLFQDLQRLSDPAVRRSDAVCRFQQGDPAWQVSVDRIQMVQVLLNLVLNAIEALETTTDQPREIDVIAACPSPQFLEMTVADNGPGLPPELTEQIFEAFVTTKPTGLGMGLSISRSIVEGHDGKLTAESQPGVGTRFVIRLPRHDRVSLM